MKLNLLSPKGVRIMMIDRSISWGWGKQPLERDREKSGVRRSGTGARLSYWRYEPFLWVIITLFGFLSNESIHQYAWAWELRPISFLSFFWIVLSSSWVQRRDNPRYPRFHFNGRSPTVIKLITWLKMGGVDEVASFYDVTLITIPSCSSIRWWVLFLLNWNLRIYN